jgi:hypothetical protein
MNDSRNQKMLAFETKAITNQKTELEGFFVSSEAYTESNGS